jgi:hypothetical protein
LRANFKLPARRDHDTARLREAAYDDNLPSRRDIQRRALRAGGGNSLPRWRGTHGSRLRENIRAAEANVREAAEGPDAAERFDAAEAAAAAATAGAGRTAVRVSYTALASRVPDGGFRN